MNDLQVMRAWKQNSSEWKQELENIKSDIKQQTQSILQNLESDLRSSVDMQMSELTSDFKKHEKEIYEMQLQAVKILSERIDKNINTLQAVTKIKREQAITNLIERINNDGNLAFTATIFLSLGIIVGMAFFKIMTWL